MDIPATPAAAAAPPRALLISYPAQGHVIPLMDLAHRLARCDFHITFVHTEYDYARILANSTASPPPQATGGRIRVVTVPDGLGPGESRDDLRQLCDSLLRVGPESLERLIKEEEGAGYPVTCVVADLCMAWALDVTCSFGIPGAVLWPASAEVLVYILSIPKLIQEGIIDDDLGKPTSNEPYHLIPGAQPTGMSAFSWSLFNDPATVRSIFQYFRHIIRSTENANYILCNSFLDLERPAFTFAPRVIPIGSYALANSCSTTYPGSRSTYWSEDRDCLGWLDTQPPRSVIYVSFGSFAVFGARQIEELALGLELSGQPFLWVVRPGLTIADGGSGQLGAVAYPSGFEERVAMRGGMVEWAPQREVLAHPSVACFLTHCGWNSVIEAIGNGVPLLCWPYFLDQIPNSYKVCSIWRTGVRVVPDGNGLVLKEQIKEKMELLLGDQGIRVRALQLMETARKDMEQGGTSCENFNTFKDSFVQVVTDSGHRLRSSNTRN